MSRVDRAKEMKGKSERYGIAEKCGHFFEYLNGLGRYCENCSFFNTNCNYDEFVRGAK